MPSIEQLEYRLQQMEEGLIARLLEAVECTNHTLKQILTEQNEQTAILKLLLADETPQFPTAITFQETSMNPTQAGQTQVFTGTLVPAGATYPSDTTFTLTSNDPAVAPTVDSTGLVVSVTYPAGWVESTTTPLAFSYTAASVSENGSISATITPSAPPAAFPTGITFAQTT
jgi:uncharacterized protein YjdB